MSRPDALGIWLWGSVLLAALIVAWLVFARLRARFLSRNSQGAGNPWTLEGLRQLRSAGLLSDQEYERLRQGVIESVSGKRPGPGDGSAGQAAGSDVAAGSTPADGLADAGAADGGKRPAPGDGACPADPGPGPAGSAD